MKKITVIGTGFVGLPLAAAFAENGLQVICVDKDEKKIENLNKGIIPIDEPGLNPLVIHGMERGLLSFTTDLESAIDGSDAAFIAVGTPPGDDGSADLKFVREVAREIGQKMKAELIIVDKSTVPVGTAEMVQGVISEELKKRGLDIPFCVVSNPEFMAEGRAVADMMSPSRVVIGTDNLETRGKMEKLYKPFMVKSPRIHFMGVESAELTKYASNTFLALKISFINAIASLAEMLKADISDVRDGMGSDPRIGLEFLYPSVGYGGSCFPKDVKALIMFAEKVGVPAVYVDLFQAIEKVNNYQKTTIPRKIIARFGDVSGKKIALWGLSFKAKTNDMRESAAIDIVNILTSRGAQVVAYDPLAVPEAREVYLAGNESISYEEKDKFKILEGCDALIIATETGEYHKADLSRIKELLSQPIIFDGRNILDLNDVKNAGFEYYAIGRGDKLKENIHTINL